jgi:hypothetical protein
VIYFEIGHRPYSSVVCALGAKSRNLLKKRIARNALVAFAAFFQDLFEPQQSVHRCPAKFGAGLRPVGSLAWDGQDRALATGFTHKLGSAPSENATLALRSVSTSFAPLAGDTTLALFPAN